MRPVYGADDYRREVPREGPKSPYRSEFRRDYARLIHSAAFRRLAGKTQLFPGIESDFFRNRLTHSLEVAQIAKSIATKLNYEHRKVLRTSPIDTDLVEFCALAHDLGHPPFGHNGEMALDNCMRRYGGFEGNAQTLRILARVEKKVTLDRTHCGITPRGKDLRFGLNLTMRSLAAVLKYDRPIPAVRSRAEYRGVRKGYYESERKLVRLIKRSVRGPGPIEDKFKTLECQIMDIADDIAYSTYDLEDAFQAGFLSPFDLTFAKEE
ncbi:MAG TPA: dNTP triphosphohydrolase, partial [Nitrospira sp.]|nr:dNTP triphosphohydrolase [Nitrospira sp.]